MRKRKKRDRASDELAIGKGKQGGGSGGSGEEEEVGRRRRNWGGGGKRAHGRGHNGALYNITEGCPGGENIGHHPLLG